MTLYKWSITAANNATADATINWAEGQAPSSVNDSARAEMAAVAKFRDDIAGAITTGGTSTAYTLTSNQAFNSLANMSGKMVAFVPHATNGATVTLNVDGLGAKPLRAAPSTELLAGVLVQGTPYVATYNNAANEWLLHGFYGNPYNLPLGGMLDHTHTVPTGPIQTTGGGTDATKSGPSGPDETTSSDGAHTHTFTTDASGGGNAHPIVLPTVIVNYILRIL